MRKKKIPIKEMYINLPKAWSFCLLLEPVGHPLNFLTVGEVPPSPEPPPHELMEKEPDELMNDLEFMIYFIFV